jgi:predicted Zn-dependent protease
VPGALTYSTAVLSYTIASQANERMGLKFSRDQETEADICAIELMKYIKVDSTALSSALKKIKNFCILKGDYLALSGEGTHPNIDDRIARIGTPKIFSSTSYDKMISFVNSQNAIYEFNSNHFKACQNLVDRNIAAGVPTEEDYILMAMTNLCLYDTPEKNTQALELINKAKSLNVTPTINLFKQEGLILIRLKKYQEAIKALETYANSIKQEYGKLEQFKNDYLWAATKNYLDNQAIWTSKMIYRVNNL